MATLKGAFYTPQAGYLIMGFAGIALRSQLIGQQLHFVQLSDRRRCSRVRLIVAAATGWAMVAGSTLLHSAAENNQVAVLACTCLAEESMGSRRPRKMSSAVVTLSILLSFVNSSFLLLNAAGS